MELQLLNQDVEALYRFCADRPQGVTQEELQAAGWTDNTQVLSIVQQLLHQQRLSLTQLGPGKLLYQAIDPQTTAKFRGLEKEHMLVYQEIEKAGDKGAWSKVLKDTCKMQQHTITKVTKELMRRQLIKEVKSVQNRGRKVFMLWDIEPNKSVSGGTWYQDGEFASSWVESLRERCQQFLESNSNRAVTLQDVHMFVQQQPGPSTPAPEDVAAIMRTLELDGLIYLLPSPGGQLMYTQRARGPNGLIDIFSARLPEHLKAQAAPHRLDKSEPQGLVVPCLLCPLRGECRPGGRICPEKCEYITNWLKGTPNDAAAPAPPIADTDARMDDW